jgi:hypothetical protein
VVHFRTPSLSLQPPHQCQQLFTALSTTTTTTMKEENRTTSPYFQSPSLRSSSNTGTTTSKSSTYFLRSPSSVHGSIQSLGPLIYTWINSSNSDSDSDLDIDIDMDVPASCTRTSESSLSSSTPILCCAPCQTVISQATRQFSSCPTFQKQQQQPPSPPPLSQERTSSMAPSSCSSSIIHNPQQQQCCCCVERVGVSMEQSVNICVTTDVFCVPLVSVAIGWPCARRYIHGPINRYYILHIVLLYIIGNNGMACWHRPDATLYYHTN